MPNPTPDRDEGLLVKEHTRTKEPPMFRVLLHNDDYTTMPFVVYVLQHIFHHSESEATRIMLNVHHRAGRVTLPALRREAHCWHSGRHSSSK